MGIEAEHNPSPTSPQSLRWIFGIMTIPINPIAQSIDRFCQNLLKIPFFKEFIKSIIYLPSYQRRLLLLILDALIFAVALYAALYLRFDGNIPNENTIVYCQSTFLLVIFKSCFFYLFGMYRPLLRYSGLELVEILLKATLCSDGTLFILNALWPSTRLPQSVQIMGAIIAIVLVISLRVTLRRLVCKLDILSFRVKQIKQAQTKSLLSPSSPSRSVIIYGAGKAGIMLAQAILRDQKYNVVAFVDDESALTDREVIGTHIYHSAALDSLVATHNVNLILLAIPSASPTQRQRILQRLHNLSVEINTVPTLDEIVSGKSSIAQTRQVDIADLLGREEVLPDPNLLKADIANKAVLVTGAGGSIGSELCRQIAQQKPSLLALYEVSEFALYSIELELKESYPSLNCIACLGSVTDADRLRNVITTHKIETIYHAAAYKHVPLVEANPVQGVLNNSYGTLITAQTANECQVNTFVLISTDKAVRPTNVMGATKRIAELILQALAANSTTHTRFIMVRFGNVLGSSGSVVPRFRQQIVDRKPITITHPDITRYFMSIPEAARLVIQAGAMGKGGEVFLLNMGEPVKIYDLAVQMIELSGLRPNVDIEIQITGLRPGEKLYEELLIDPENTLTTTHPKIYAAKEAMIPWPQLSPLLQELFTHAKQNQTHLIKPMLKQLVIGYQPPSDRLPTPSIPKLAKVRSFKEETAFS
jgi:FlaA1/EpsC-like NDP-sugar epimerase